MISDLSQVTRQHLTNLSANAPVSLIPKRCSCGKATTAKQLAQYRKCPACVIADIAESVLPDDMIRLQHMLGAVPHRLKRQWGLRNYFCACAVGAARESMQRLVAAGLAIKGHEGDLQTDFHATHLGCKVAGLDAAGVRRAMRGTK